MLALGAGLLAAGAALAQYPSRPAPHPGAAPRTPPVPPGSAGKVLYFHKPADALAPAGLPAGGPAVASAGTVVRPAGGVPDVPTHLPVVQPAPAAVPLGPDPTIALPPPAPSVPALPPLPDAARPAPGVPTAIPPATVPVARQGKGETYKKIDVPDSETRRPDPTQVFMLRDDAHLEQASLTRLRADVRARDETKDPKKPFSMYPPDIRFPALPPVGDGKPYRPKSIDYPPMKATYEPGYVVHRRLHFEEKNSERYGWDLGIVQPFVSAMYFYRDVLLWPNSLASGCAYGFWDTNAGKCLPGSPTPYFLYPPGLTITGTAAEGLIITGAAFAFP